MHFPWLMALARLVLEPDDVDRMVEPTLADALYEHGERPPVAARVLLAARVVAVIVLATGARAWEQARQASWWPVGTAVLAGVAGALGIEHAPGGWPLARAHLLFVALGVVAAILAVVAPPRGFRVLGGVATALAVLGLVLLPWLGQPIDGARRWLTVGPLSVHVAVLTLPVLGEWQAIIARRRSAGLHLLAVGALLALLAAQPDLVAIVAFGAIAAVTGGRSIRSAGVLLLTAGAALVAASRETSLGPVAQVEGALALLAEHRVAWLAIGLGAVSVTVGGAVHTWLAARRSFVRDELLVARAGAASAGLCSFVVVPLLLQDGGVPWLSFGGSALCASFVWTALCLRVGRELRRPYANELPGVA